MLLTTRSHTGRAVISRDCPMQDKPTSLRSSLGTSSNQQCHRAGTSTMLSRMKEPLAGHLSHSRMRTSRRREATLDPSRSPERQMRLNLAFLEALGARSRLCGRSCTTHTSAAAKAKDLRCQSTTRTRQRSCAKSLGTNSATL